MTPGINVLIAALPKNHSPQGCARLAERGNYRAWLAVSVIHQSEHLVTFDTDFRKLLRPAQVTVL
jgi:hypothetical protein